MKRTRNAAGFATGPEGKKKKTTKKTSIAEQDVGTKEKNPSIKETSIIDESQVLETKVKSPSKRQKSIAEKARELGASDFKPSPKRYKKWAVLYKGEWIHFGDNRYQDYTQHEDPKRRASYLARARGIKDGQGRLTANNPYSANFWAIRLLW